MKQLIVCVLSMYWLSAASEECQECDAPQTKGGVAMLVKTHHAKHVSGSDTSVNTKGFEREAALVSKLLANPTAELSLSTVNELKNMRITPEVSSFIKGTLETLKPVFDGIESCSNNDTSARDAFLAGFDELAENLTKVWKGYYSISNGTEEARQKHFKCRNKTELEKLQELTTCNSELKALESELNMSLEVLTGDDSTCRSLFCPLGAVNVVMKLPEKIACTEAYNLSAHEYMTAYNKYWTKHGECAQIHKEYVDIKKDCLKEQNNLEACVCMLGNHGHTKCPDESTAYNTHLSDYNLFLDGLDNRVKKRIFEWKHLKRVGCTLGALATHTIETHASLSKTIENCQKDDFENPELDIDPTPAPPAGACPSIPDLPCGDEYIKEEYTSVLNPLTPADVQKCRKCRLR